MSDTKITGISAGNNEQTKRLNSSQIATAFRESGIKIDSNQEIRRQGNRIVIPI
ncbi:MAG: hypothetical protein MK033_01695 [Candidatus Caenarcaniphilales bacterium]|nr:hypothetical protein [Candidatus Caenarcaniphilales bacterium]